MTDAAGLKESIGSRIRVAREQAGLSQGQVARRLDLHRPTISEIEAGRRRVSVDELSLFAEIYDVSVEWLASGTENVHDPAVELAARELARLKPEDLNAVMNLLRKMRRGGLSK